MIAKIVIDSQAEQRTPLADVNVRLVVIEEEYKSKLQSDVDELDADKAQVNVPVAV